MTAEHRRGHGTVYDGLGSGRIEVGRLRTSLVSLPVPRDEEGRITLAVDVSPWLRPDAATSLDRSFCHVYGRGKGQAQMIPGRPYSFVAALEPGRTLWTALLDALRLGPDDDATTVTATQLREVIQRLQQAGQHKPGDADTLRRFDLEHTFRFLKQTLDWTRPRIRTPDQGNRRTWIIVAAHIQLRLARHLTSDLRRPWEKPVTEPHRLTPARIRRRFRNLRPKTTLPASAPKPSHRGGGGAPAVVRASCRVMIATVAHSTIASWGWC